VDDPGVRGPCETLRAVDHPILLLLLLVATGAFLVVAYLTKLPYPIWLVIGGAVIGFIPAVPNAALKPDLVLVLLLPPLLWSAAFFSSVRDLRADAGPISFLAIGLVLATTLGLAVIGHEVVGLSWEVSFVLGAVLSPTDPVAATAIGRRVGAPPRIVTVVEGESLLNDSTALVAYKFAIAAVLAGGFSLSDAAAEFVVDVVAGVAVGLAVGWAGLQLLRRLDDAPTEIALTLLIPYVAYLPCEEFGVSAVLAAVSAGLFLGWNAPRLFSPPTRIQAYSFWEILVFGINATLFMLLGLELPAVFDGIEGMPVMTVVGNAAVVVAGVIAVRFLWVFGTAGLRGAVRRARRLPRSESQWRQRTLVAWTGMRGAVSLATALAIPVALDDGTPFPNREMVIFLAYVTILATVLGQGLTLPWLIRRLGLAGVGVDREAASEREARLAAVDAALDRIDELRDEDWVPTDQLGRVEFVYEARRRRLADQMEPVAGEEPGRRAEAWDGMARVRRELQDAQRERILELRNEGVINDEIMRKIERDLDLEDVRLGQ